jgi:uncharacterized protein YdhG (YjbR/CyaY superfamily)
MASKSPPTVAAYLAGLPPGKRDELQRVRAVVKQHLPDGYQETVSSGMIVYQVPLARYADTYNGHPLWYAALAAQKNHLSLHLMNAYGSPALARKLRDGFKAAGKKLDMGKACIRFRAADDLALETIGEIVASTPLERFVEVAAAARRR